jgi:hypothetical protein
MVSVLLRPPLGRTSLVFDSPVTTASLIRLSHVKQSTLQPRCSRCDYVLHDISILVLIESLPFTFEVGNASLFHFAATSKYAHTCSPHMSSSIVFARQNSIWPAPLLWLLGTCRLLPRAKFTHKCALSCPERYLIPEGLIKSIRIKYAPHAATDQVEMKALLPPA